MKPSVLFLAGAVMLASASTAAAQGATGETRQKTYTSPCDWKGDSKKLVKQYRNCLASDNEGVVESTLAHLLWIRVAVPCVDITPLKADVERLSIKGKPASIRLRAYLTDMVFEDPQEFKELARHDFDGPEELFAGVTNMMYAAESGDQSPAIANGR